MDSQNNSRSASMRWYQPVKEVPPAINPTNANGDYRPEYVEWLRNLKIETWDEICQSLESGAFDYAEWDNDDVFCVRLFADTTEDGYGFEYTFAINRYIYDDDGLTEDIEDADMKTSNWVLVQACAFMWQSDPAKWSLENY